MKMNQKISIYVPATIGNECIDNQAQVEHVAQQLSLMFGGASASKIQGFWNSDNLGLVVEETTVVYAFTSFWKRVKFRKQLKNLMNWIKVEMAQEAVLMEINGSAELS